MRVVRHHRFGPPEVLQLETADEPTPARGEVRVRVAAAALNPKDVLVRKGRFAWLSGRRFPMGTGFDVAGTIDALGPNVEGFAVGDRVFGFLSGFRGRTCAEAVVVPASGLSLMPSSLSWGDAASVALAGSTALQALRDVGRVRSGARVLLHGASGGVGAHAVQIARALGAHVTTTSGEASRSRCASWGAHETLTYDDPSAPFQAGTRYDAIVDIYGNRSFAWAARGLTALGTYVSTVPSRRILTDALRTLVTRKRARLVTVRARTTDLATLASMMERGDLRAQIDRRYPLDRVAEGHAHLETRHATGKVVIDIAP